MKKNYLIVDHQFINTGGNCMVSIFPIYERQNKVTRYLYISDEYAVYQTTDTLSADLQEEWDDSYDEFVLFDYAWQAFTECRLAGRGFGLDKELIELIVDCRFEFLKQYCKYFGHEVSVDYNELPTTLMDTLDPDVVVWHVENEAYFRTDGYTVSPHSLYKPAKDESCESASDKQLQSIKDFREWLKENTIDDVKLPMLYDIPIEIKVGDESVEVPFWADTYSALDCLLRVAIEEW